MLRKQVSVETLRIPFTKIFPQKENSGFRYRLAENVRVSKMPLSEDNSSLELAEGEQV